MTFSQSLVVALALALSPSLGCSKKKNADQQPAEGSSGVPAAVGSGTNPNLPNPANAGTALAPRPTDTSMDGDAGVDATAGSGATGATGGSGVGSGAAGSAGGSGSGPM